MVTIAVLTVWRWWCASLEILVISDYIVRTGEVRQHLRSRPINSNGVQIAVTKIDISPKYGAVKPKGFYVYLHRRVSDGVVFYVGKGKYRRGWSVSTRSDMWAELSSGKVRIEIVRDGMTECCALTLEMILIGIYGGVGPESNLCNGNRGGAGRVSCHVKLPDRGKGAEKRLSIIHCSNGMTFHGAKAAVRWLKSDTEHSSAIKGGIYKAVNGKIGSAYGFAWWKDGEKPKKYVDPKYLSGISKCKRVVCSNGMVFNSLNESVAWVSTWRNGYGCNVMISSCCKGKRDKAYGYSWRFEDDE